MDRAWWKEAVVYQVYPRSFYDSNGDGIGDINGVTAKIGYLKELGVDVIWLSPVYKSPGDDNGYDVSDYRDISKEFGTLEDWDRLLCEVHRSDMKLIMDLVVNHTSDEHPWFLESRKAKDNPYRDYYIWRDGRNGEPPSNWQSFFSGSAWQLDEQTGQYYLHLFTKKQPDLNWTNPQVRQEVCDIMTFWLERGVDGFRMDAINLIAKDMTFPDMPIQEDGSIAFAVPYHSNQPESHAYLRELNERVLSRYNCMSVGETSSVTPENGRDYTAPERCELGMLIQFEHMELDTGATKWERAEYRPLALKRVFTRWQEGLNDHGWNCNYLSNHDQPRQVSRFGSDTKYRYESATMLGTLIHTVQGTPFIYQGEELGMTNIWLNHFDEFRDVEIANWLAKARRSPAFDEAEALERVNRIGRDNARTPMQWDDSENAGFTSGTPWITVNPNYVMINAREQMENPHSVFSFYKKLISIRHSLNVLVYGGFCDLLPEHPDIFVFTRSLDDQKLMVLLNLTDKHLHLEKHPPAGEVLLSNYAGRPISESGMLLPYEAQITLLK